MLAISCPHVMPLVPAIDLLVGEVPAVLVPANHLLSGNAERHHGELQIKPVRLEPQKKIDAENDRK